MEGSSLLYIEDLLSLHLCVYVLCELKCENFQLVSVCREGETLVRVIVIVRSSALPFGGRCEWFEDNLKPEFQLRRRS